MTARRGTQPFAEVEGGWVTAHPSKNSIAFSAHDVDVLAVHSSRRHVSAKVRVMVDFLVAAFRGKPLWD